MMNERKEEKKDFRRKVLTKVSFILKILRIPFQTNGLETCLMYIKDTLFIIQHTSVEKPQENQR